MAVPASGPTGRYGGVSAADRRSERRERLLDAALEILGTEGWHATTVRGVCERARLNPRYFYESFGDLDELVVAVFDRIAEEMIDRMLTAFAEAPKDAEAKARAPIATCVDYVAGDPRRARVLFLEALGNEALARRRLETMDAMWQLLGSYGREFYGHAADPDPISDVAAVVLVGGMTELMIAWLDGRIEIGREQLIDDFTRLFVLTREGAVAIARRRAQARR
jgi:AcrR family transcriptional regulator